MAVGKYFTQVDLLLYLCFFFVERDYEQPVY